MAACCRPDGCAGWLRASSWLHPIAKREGQGSARFRCPTRSLQTSPDRVPWTCGGLGEIRGRSSSSRHLLIILIPKPVGVMAAFRFGLVEFGVLALTDIMMVISATVLKFHA